MIGSQVFRYFKIVSTLDNMCKLRDHNIKIVKSRLLASKSLHQQDGSYLNDNDNSNVNLKKFKKRILSETAKDTYSNRLKIGDKKAEKMYKVPLYSINDTIVPNSYKLRDVDTLRVSNMIALERRPRQTTKPDACLPILSLIRDGSDKGG